MKKAVWIVVAVIVVLSVYTIYANVLSDDVAVRAEAELAARAKAGCGEKCVMLKMEGSRGAFSEQLELTFKDVKDVISVACKRPYVAFGAYKCTAK